MNKLFIFSHPYNSRAGSAIVEEAKLNGFDVMHIESEYSTLSELDVEKEQERLSRYSEIVFHSPFFWWNVTPGMKAYIDNVFTSGFSHAGGDKMKDKKIVLSSTTGGKKERYEDEEAIEHYFKWFKNTVKYIGSEFKGTVVLYGLSEIKNEEIKELASSHIDKINLLF